MLTLVELFVSIVAPNVPVISVSWDGETGDRFTRTPAWYPRPAPHEKHLSAVVAARVVVRVGEPVAGLRGAVTVDLHVLDRDAVPNLEHGLVVIAPGGEELHDGRRPTAGDRGVRHPNAGDHARSGGKGECHAGGGVCRRLDRIGVVRDPVAHRPERPDVDDGRGHGWYLRG